MWALAQGVLSYPITEGAVYDLGAMRQRLEYTKLWVMWAIIFGFEVV
jgi:hypothetical protein